MNLKAYTAPLIAFAAIVVAALFLASVNYSWSQWQEASCMPDACFCEAIREGTVRQPVNTWSCFAFVLIGLLIISQASKDQKASKDASSDSNLIRKSMAYGATYGIALILIGLGSAFFHASLTLVGQFFDVSGMYLLGSFLVIYNFSRRFSMSPRSFAIVYVILNIILIAILANVPELRRYVFALLILITLGLEYVIRRSPMYIETKWMKLALGLFIVAFVIWILDIRGIICAPYSLFQGHAIWHILGALAAGCFYLYYRSENVIGRLHEKLG